MSIPLLTSPFKNLVVGLGALPSEFEDSMTYYEALCWIIKYLEDTIISKINEIGEAQNGIIDAFNELKNYVEHYFDNLDVQEEINNKLDAMVEDHTLDDIINHEIFNELSSSVENLENTKYDSNLFVATFFDNSDNHINFLTSTDGINFSTLEVPFTLTGRDPQIIYNSDNKKFYISVTGGNDSSDFTCFITSDFATYETKYPNLGILSGTRWAPELFIDDDDTMYAVISRRADESSPFQIYLAECTDVETLTFTAATPLSLNETNVIDPNLTKKDGTYYLTVKDEDTAKIMVFSSSDLVNWSSVNTNLLNSDEMCEGACVVKVGNHFNIYGDTWNSYGYYIAGQTTSLASTAIPYIRPASLIGQRHGSVCYLTNKEAVHLVTSLDGYNNSVIIKNGDTRQISISGNISTLVVYPNFTYRVTNDCTITTLANPFKLSLFPFIFAGAMNRRLNITNIVNTEGTTKVKNYSIKNSVFENEKLNAISLIGDCFILRDNATPKTLTLPSLAEGWTAQWVKFERVGNLIHLDLTLTKTSADAPSNLCTLDESIRPHYYTFVPNDRGIAKITINSNGVFNAYGISTVNQDVYCSVTYLSN